MKKSQSAIEFMSMVGIGLILIAITSFIGADYISSYFTDINIINGEQTVETIVAASSLVYSQGIGAQTRISVTLPSNIARNFTYISGREVNLRLQQQGTQDLFKETGVNISGTLPLTSGKNYLYIKMVPSSNPDSAQGEVKVYLDDPVYSYIGVQTYSYNGSQYVFSSNFSINETGYFKIQVTDINDSQLSPEVELNVYNSAGTPIIEELITVDHNEYYNLSDIDMTGTYLISVRVPDVNAVGTKIFHIY